MTFPRTSHVIRPHKATYPEPLVIKAGESVTVGRSDTEYPGWIWCTHSSGRSAWVPERFLQRNGDFAVLLRDYDSTELTVDIGDQLALLGEESGWFWCRDGRGRLGWVPVTNVR